jgi:hypothetical protein
MPNSVRRLFVVLTVLIPLVLHWGCGRSDRGRTGSDNVAASRRLNQEDVNLYLELMREAAKRVQNLLPGDIAALARMNKVQDDMEAGRIPTPVTGDPAAEVIARGMMVKQAMDEVIAEEHGLDVEHYRSIRDQIERTINPTNSFPDEGEEVLGQRATRQEAETQLANKKILAPHADEIEQLYQLVRRSLSEK